MNLIRELTFGKETKEAAKNVLEIKPMLGSLDPSSNKDWNKKLYDAIRLHVRGAKSVDSLKEKLQDFITKNKRDMKISEGEWDWNAKVAVALSGLYRLKDLPGLNIQYKQMYKKGR